MDTEAAARAWADAWARAWRALDPDLLEPIYGPDSVQRSHPFREPGHPMDYARWAMGEEEGEPEVWMADPLVTGDRAAIEWWAVIVESGKQISLAGTSVVRFAEDGHAVEQIDYWGQADGRVPPFPAGRPAPPGVETQTLPTAFIVAKTVSRGMPPLFARKLSRSIYSEERGYRDDLPFDVSSQTGSRFVGTTKDQLAHGFSLVGYNEWRLWAVALALCREGDTIVEIGANIGTETVGFSDIVGPGGKVVAFEPVPPALESLRLAASTFRSRNVEIIPCAVGDTNGQVSIRVPARDLGEATLARELIDDGADIAVACVTLDSLSERLGRPRMLFIDAEGSEPVILAGGRDFIRRCTPDIVVEANPKCLAALGSNAALLLGELESLGYTVARLTRLGVDSELRTDFRGYENWLAVTDPRRFAAVARLVRRCALLPCLWPLHPFRSPRRGRRSERRSG